MPCLTFPPSFEFKRTCSVHVSLAAIDFYQGELHMPHSTRHLAAESFAKRIPLPLKACPTTLDLFGYTHPILNRPAAVRALCEEGYLVGTEAHDAAMAILEARAEAVVAR
jgi:hypothetical protein